MPPMLMKHEEDPRVEMLRELGDISGYHVQNNQVLVRVYERPKMTRSGIHLADRTREEDQYQGKAALIVAVGPAAFDPDNNQGYWRGVVPKLHDWIALRPSDGWPINVNGKLCRMITDGAARMIIPAPDVVW